MSNQLQFYGGQAVLEGVMMRGTKAMSVAVRAPDGGIRILTEPLGNLYRGSIKKIPFVRGVIGLWDALGLGMKSLAFAAQVVSGEEIKMDSKAMSGAVIISLTFAVGLFFLVPAFVGAGVEYFFGTSSGWIGNFAEGLIRLSLVIGYIWAIGFMPDIKRLYGYHGAEHKTINAFEAGAELTPHTVARFPLEHPRCGTAFLLVVVVLSILFFSLLGPLPITTRLVSRLLMVPILAGIAFEYLRFTAKYISNPFIRLIVAPNLLMQRLTTREPDLEMLEVAITSFNAMREKEKEEEVVS